MPLGASLWNNCESFYTGLSLADHGIADEQEFARQPTLVSLFPKYVEFWQRHVCPATVRPHGTSFRIGTSEIVCNIVQRNYSILVKLTDAADSLAKVQAGDFGRQFRNWRDTIEAAGNALQQLTELQYDLTGKPPKSERSTRPNLPGQLAIQIDPFPDWNTNWETDRKEVSKYRNYLVHAGLPYSVYIKHGSEVLVLSRSAFSVGGTFSVGGNWKQAEASYNANPSQWQRIETAGHEIVEDTVTFINRAYERLLAKLDGLLINPKYQELWGWGHNIQPLSLPAHAATQGAGIGQVSMSACSASKTV